MVPIYVIVIILNNKNQPSPRWLDSAAADVWTGLPVSYVCAARTPEQQQTITNND